MYSILKLKLFQKSIFELIKIMLLIKMNKQILIFVLLISVILSTYRPMTKRTIDFGENICYYKEYGSGSNQQSIIEYVKPCPQGKFCYDTESSVAHGNSEHDLHTCEIYAPSRKVFGASCETNFECNIDYDNSPSYIFECSSNKVCALKSTSDYTSTYKVEDSLSNLIIYHCPSNKYPLSLSYSDSISCTDLPTDVQESNFSGKHKFTISSASTSTSYYAGGKPYQVPGLLHFKDITNSNVDYVVDNIDYSDIGTVEDGNFVSNTLACKSGFALYFFGNGKLTKTTGIASPTPANMYLYCVTLKEYISPKEVVYSISGGDEKVYNLAQISENEGSTLGVTNLQFEQNLLTKLEMFKNYREKLDIEKCRGEYEQYYSEPFTCKNNELRKWWYFYHYPDEYLVYKDEPLVMDYLVQQAFPEYASESSGFLAFKYIIYLFILLTL